MFLEGRERDHEEEHSSQATGVVRLRCANSKRLGPRHGSDGTKAG
jgi:hypothetical protein